MLPSDIFYSRFADYYNEYATQKSAYLEAVNQFVKNESGPCKEIIDIGSGNGKRAEYIARMLGLKNITLVDNSDGMIALCKNSPNITIIKDDISNSNFKIGKKYGIVLCLWNVLGHIPTNKERIVAVKNLAGLLKADGFLFLDVNNRHNFSHYGFKAAQNLLKDLLFPGESNGDFRFSVNTKKERLETRVHIFTKREIERLLKSTGLKIVSKRMINYRTGKKSWSQFGGQLVYKLAKI